jgi:ribosome-binding protein aMBF1 (putative translation factor)
MPRKLALKTGEGAAPPAPGQQPMPAGKRTRPAARSRATPQTSQGVPGTKAPKIGFDQSCDTETTEVFTQSRLRRRQEHGSDKPIESQLQRQCFAKNFRAARKDAGLSQRDIQARTGLPQSHISEIESAMHNICIETMVKLANLVHVPVHELLKP